MMGCRKKVDKIICLVLFELEIPQPGSGTHNMTHGHHMWGIDILFLNIFPAFTRKNISNKPQCLAQRSLSKIMVPLFVCVAVSHLRLWLFRASLASHVKAEVFVVLYDSFFFFLRVSRIKSKELLPVRRQPEARLEPLHTHTRVTQAHTMQTCTHTARTAPLPLQSDGYYELLIDSWVLGDILAEHYTQLC